MIQIIEGLPDNVVGIVAKGRVTNEDYKKILKPFMEKSLRRQDKARLYYEISSRFPGAAWEDLRIAVEHVPQWERVAVVTDVGWIRHTVNALRFLIPGEVRVFTTPEAYQGRAWISSAMPERHAVIHMRREPEAETEAHRSGQRRRVVDVPELAAVTAPGPRHQPRQRRHDHPS
jgi:hypothetical protein